MKFKYTILDIQDVAKKKGGKCLSKKYVGSQKHLLWECAKGHKWSAKPNHIINTATLCPECAGRRKITIGEMKELAQKRGGKCLSKEYVNNKTRLKWQCAKGHTWSSPPTCLLNSNTWCNICAGRKTLKDMQLLAKKRGGKCLSKEYKNVTSQLLWQCAKGHQWNTRPVNILHKNTWCHTCSKYGKLTIEEMQQIAAERDGECLSKKYTNSAIKLKWKCKKNHTWWAAPQDVKNSGSWCPLCVKNTRLTIERLKKIAMNKGGVCLSDDYIVGKKLTIRCNYDHLWEAHANSLTSGRWCPNCRNFNEEKCTLMSKDLDPYIISQGQDKNITKPVLRLTPFWANVLAKLEERKVKGWQEICYVLLNLHYDEQKRAEAVLKKLVNNIRKGKVKNKHNWIKFTTSNKDRQFSIILYPYLNEHLNVRNEMIQKLIGEEYEQNESAKGIVLIGVNIDEEHYPYSIVVALDPLRLFASEFSDMVVKTQD